jgi:hypothetical protein
MSHCNTCNASHSNTVERIVRCGACVVRPMLPPTKWKPKPAQEQTE